MAFFLLVRVLAAFPQEFSVATLNVDGLPEKFLWLKVNPNGPGKRYTPTIGARLVEGRFDFIAVQENFNFSEALFAALDSAYFHDEWQGGILGGSEFNPFRMRISVDGLNGFWRQGAVILQDESSARWSRSCGKITNIREHSKCPSCSGELYQRDDDNEQTIRNRLKVFHEQTEALVEFYRTKGLLIEIDATGMPDEIFSRVLETLRND